MPRGVPNKKLEKKILTEEDFVNNPQLAEEGFKVGDEIELPPLDEEQSVENTKGSESQEPDKLDKLMDMMGTVASTVSTLKDRVERLETGGANDFKKDKNPEDVARAMKSREDQDPRVVELINEILGEDFSFTFERVTDNELGLLFTLIVPSRLSLLPKSTRPIWNEDQTDYKRDPRSGEPIEELYQPEDRRSRAVPTTSSYDMIRQHCENVRNNIVATYAKSNKGTPEFRLS